MMTVRTYRPILTFENNSLSTDGDNINRLFVDVDPDGFLSVLRLENLFNFNNF